MNQPADVPTDVLVRTRRSLHGVAELVLAGPQYRRSGTIRLRVIDGGFVTFREPQLRVDGVELVVGDMGYPISGTTYADLGRLAGVDPGPPEGLYRGGSGVQLDEIAEVDPAATRWITQSLHTGVLAMRELAVHEQPVLWPEHFDVGITLDEVNYGVSPGDDYRQEPYAYVGPWKQREGGFWNAPFGAFRPMRDVATPEALFAFFAEGRARAGQDPVDPRLS
jgi:hypothetical protein